MGLHPQSFNPRQQMAAAAFELQYKRDSYLKNVDLHHHDFYEIYFLVSGDVTYTIESKLYHVMPGDLLLISPKELHQVYIDPERNAYERYVLWVDPQTIRRLSTLNTDLGQRLDPLTPGYGNQLRLAPENQQRIRQLMEALYQETQMEQYGADLMRSSCLIQLLVQINRLAAQENNYMAEVRTNKLVSQAIAYIQSHYSEPLSLEKLAEQLYVSKYHLSHEFHRMVGTSVYQYIQKKRLLIARQFLFEGVKANDACARCGFSDYAGFYRAFKMEYGISPREYVRECHQNNNSDEISEKMG